MKFVKESFIAATPERVFGFHELPDAFERLIPPWEKLKIVQKADLSKVGSRAIIELKLLGFTVARIVAEHTIYEPPKMFEDTLISGPFKYWRHRHIVKPHKEGAVLIDEIEFDLPFSFLGRAASPVIILPKLRKMFEFRHRVTKEWCENNEST